MIPPFESNLTFWDWLTFLILFLVLSIYLEHKTKEKGEGTC